jgi:hypothetical protein
MLQVRMSPVRVPDEVDFLNLPNPSSRTTAPGSTQPLTEMSTRNLPGGKKRPITLVNITLKKYIIYISILLLYIVACFPGNATVISGFLILTLRHLSELQLFTVQIYNT